MPRGEPTFEKFDEKRRGKYLEKLRGGCRRCKAARAAGVSIELVRLYRNANPSFEGQELEAEEEANAEVESALFNEAKRGNVRACEVWLYNRDPQRWKDQRNLNIRKSVEEMSDEELLAIAAGGGDRTSPPARPVGADGDRNGHRP